MFLGKLMVSALLLLMGCSATKHSTHYNNASAEVVRNIIFKVNDHWQEIHEPGKPFWDEAVYHTGNIAAYKVTHKQQYYDYSFAWAERNEWKGAKSNNKQEWKYKYGETDEHVLFGDWQVCFQTYIDLYQLDKDEKKIARAREVMEYEMSTPQNDYWWWVDGLYMVMPVMTKLYKITGSALYLEKLYEYFTYTSSILYDAEAGFYFRDAKYVYPAQKTAAGKKDFWARGNGWAFAALSKVLNDLPAQAPHHHGYVVKYKAMALALKNAQRPEGHWTRSLLDAEQAPGFETSGTAFFTFGMLWGMNNGILNEADYLPVVQKSWNYLIHTALQSDGTIGYVQPIGERAIPGQVVDKSSTSNFGVGAFLLAAAEMYRYLDRHD